MSFFKCMISMIKVNLFHNFNLNSRNSSHTHFLSHRKKFSCKCGNNCEIISSNNCQLSLESKTNCVKCDLKDFSASMQNILEQFSDKSFMKQIKKKSNLYLTDKATADIVASHVCEDSKNSYIFEANPGPGFLSKAILDAGASRLRLFEKNHCFLPILKSLKSIYSKSLEIVEEDIMFLPSVDAQTRPFGSVELEKYFCGIPEYSWSAGIPFKFVSVISGKKSIMFFRYLLAALSTKSTVFAYGRCEFYFLLCDAEYKYLIAEPRENLSNYRWSTVLYNLFFEIKCLKKFSSDLFYPPPTRDKKQRQDDETQLHLVKLQAKADLFQAVANHNKLPELYFFVRHHLVKRTAFVIPTLESWIPYCGPRLIKEGMNVFTKFGDLSPDQILALFKQFSSWPEYEDSPFCAAIKNFHERRNSVCDDDEIL